MSNLIYSQVRIRENSGFSGALLNGQPVLSNSTGNLWTTDGTPAGTRIFTTKVTLTANGSSILAMNKSFFSGFSPEHGEELWCSDGTDAGTFLLKDIFPGVNGSDIKSFFKWNNKVFFFADDGVHGRELWITDGTTGGTKLLKDLRPGNASSVLSSFAMSYIGVTNQVFFITNDNQQGWELWRTDGTEAGTQMVKDFNRDISDDFSNKYIFFKQIGENIYFVADDGVHGAELWRSNGTASETMMVKDVVHGETVGVNDAHVVLFNNKLLFPVEQGNGEKELWTSDGTAAGTVKVKTFTDVNSLPFLAYGIAFPDGFVFTQYYDGGARLWRTNGTEAGTVPIFAVGPYTFIDIRPSFTDEFKVIHQPSFNGRTFFTTMGLFGNNDKLWLTNGTEAGTTQVANNIRVRNYLHGASHFYFFNDHQVTGDSISLFKTHGTPSGTMVIQSFPKATNASPNDPTIHFEYNGQVYYSADDGQDNFAKSDFYRTGPLVQPVAVYTFTGNGNWENPANWLNNLAPPANISSGEIIIDHVNGGECVRNAAQTLAPGVKLTIRSGKRLRIVN